MGMSHSKLDPNNISNLMECTHFERKEIISWYDHFIHQYPSGYLQKESLSNAYLRYFPFGNPKPYVNQMFRLFQVKEAEQEFLMVLSITSRGKLEEKLSWCFKFYDVNGDGLISKSDMLETMNAIYLLVGPMVTHSEDERTPELKATKLFMQMGCGENEVITREQFDEAARLDPTIVQGLVLYDVLAVKVEDQK